MPENNTNPEREQRILDAAAKLFAHYGYDKTTVSDIAEEAGISKGAVYLHYKSKEDLFDALILHEGERLLDILLARVEADPEAGSIVSLYWHSIMAAYESPLMLALMRQDTKVIGDMSRRMNSATMRVQGDFIRHELVAQLQAANVIRPDLDANVIAYVMALIKYGFWMIGDVIPREEAPSLEVVGKTLGQVLERGLAPEGGGDKQAGKAAMENILHMMRGFLKQMKEGQP